MLIFPNKTLEKIYYHAEAEYPRECCGIILGKRKNEQRIAHSVIETKNTVVEKDAEVHFQIDPFDVAKVERMAEAEQLEIVGFYHSHIECTAFPSVEDMRHMIEGYSYPIVSVKNGRSVSVRSYEKALQTDAYAKEEALTEEW